MLIKATMIPARNTVCTVSVIWVAIHYLLSIFLGRRRITLGRELSHRRLMQP
jgi:hypothetical protein